VQFDFGDKMLAAFGSNPVYYVIREDALWLALGPDGVNALKAVVEAKPQPAPPLDYALAFARLAPLIPGGRATAEQALNAIVAPTGILLRQANDQVSDLVGKHRSSGLLLATGTIVPFAAVGARCGGHWGLLGRRIRRRYSGR
jgi:hypothetical protein